MIAEPTAKVRQSPVWTPITPLTGSYSTPIHSLLRLSARQVFRLPHGLRDDGTKACCREVEACVYAIGGLTAMIAFMQAKQAASETLAASLMEAFLPIIKGSQAEIMAVTADLDLTLSQGRILLELERGGEDLAVSDLAARISLSMAAAGRAVDSLHRSGMLTRREDDVDRRIKRIGLTDRGHAMITEIMQVRRQVAERFVGALDDTERAALAEAVATIGSLTSTHLPAIRGSCDARSRAKEAGA